MRLLFSFIAIGLFFNSSLGQNTPLGGISFGMSYSPNDTVCAGTTIYFVASTSSYGVSFSWGSNDTTRHFSPASTTAFSSSVTLNCITPGTFTVYLMAFKMGPAGLKQVTIVVLPNPNVSLSISPKTICTTQSQIQWAGGSPLGGNYIGPRLFGDSVLQPGTYVYTYTYNDGNGCEASASDSMNVNICTSVSEAKTPSGFNIFPNPAFNEINISLENKKSTPLLIYDGSGRKIKEVVLAEEVNTISISDLENGMYFISMEGYSTKKLVKN